MRCSRLMLSVSALVFAFSAAAEEFTVEVGEIDKLTNALKKANSVVYLKPGVHDLSSRTNAPMYAPGYYGASLLAVASGCKIVGMSGNPADVVLNGGNRFRIFRTKDRKSTRLNSSHAT